MTHSRMNFDSKNVIVLTCQHLGQVGQLSKRPRCHWSPFCFRSSSSFHRHKICEPFLLKIRLLFYWKSDRSPCNGAIYFQHWLRPFDLQTALLLPLVRALSLLRVASTFPSLLFGFNQLIFKVSRSIFTRLFFTSFRSYFKSHIQHFVNIQTISKHPPFLIPNQIRKIEVKTTKRNFEVNRLWNLFC